MEGLGISALRVDIEPGTPSSHEPVLLEEAFCDRVVCKIIPIREADRTSDEAQRINFTGKYVLDSPAKLARGCTGSGFVVLYMRYVKTAMTVALDMKPKSFAEIGRLSDVEARIDQFSGPPVSVLDLHANFVWSLQQDSAI